LKGGGKKLMIIIPLEELLPKAGYSIYRLVRMASKRALELSDGKKPLIEISATDKLTSIALEEIAQGKIECKEMAGEQEDLEKKL
jgi:DNA-directed RNA polymerase omega subunit